jgi:hypothetical protein
MYSGKIAVPPGGGGIVLHKNTHYNVRVLEIVKIIVLRVLQGDNLVV